MCGQLVWLEVSVWTFDLMGVSVSSVDVLGVGVCSVGGGGQCGQLVWWGSM